MSHPIVFLSDFGFVDEFVGVCHGIMAGIAPESRVIDLTHSIPPLDVRSGARVLAESLPFMPSGSVFLAVVDPSVGGRRRALAVRSGARALLVGPDNGLLSLAWESLGGVTKAVVITAPEVLRHPVSSTFQARDIFAPAAAHLAAGMPLERLGPPVDPASLVAVRLPEPDVAAGTVRTSVLHIDRFGNVALAARESHLVQAGLIEATAVEVASSRTAVTAVRVGTFADVPQGNVGLVLDSSGWLALTVDRASAASLIGLATGDAVELRALES